MRHKSIFMFGGGKHLHSEMGGKALHVDQIDLGDMSKSYSVTDWALHDGNDTGTDHEGFWAERLQDEDDPDMESGIL